MIVPITIDYIVTASRLPEQPMTGSRPGETAPSAVATDQGAAMSAGLISG